ncbi:STAS domain-containing protein [bacterium]|jgi:anti-sigma B factor antagonist|nr:STAS domain-containing protein [bacterium]
MFDAEKRGMIGLVRGDSPIHATSLDQLKRVLDPLKDTGQPNLVLDLRRVPLVDSAGLEYLLDAFDACRSQGGTLKLLSPTPLVTEILQVTGVSSFFEIFTDEVAAIGSFTK